VGLFLLLGVGGLAGALLFASQSAKQALIKASEDLGLPVPRGIKNNNPGNLRASDSFTWQGQIGVDDKGFCVFDTSINGIRALIINAFRLQEQGDNTLYSFGLTWAPPADNNGTTDYGLNLASQIGVDPNAQFDLGTGSPFTAIQLAKAICHNENGIDPYDDSTYSQASDMGLQYVSINPRGANA
jgi:hypothetical protein